MSAQPPEGFALIRVDLHFSGSFADMDVRGSGALALGPDGLHFECEDDELLDDLSDALMEFGVDPEEVAIVDVEGDGLIPPRDLDPEATEASGWPRFKVGARFLRFLALPCAVDEALLRATKEAYSMAVVRLTAPALLAYDEGPSIAVAHVTHPDQRVDSGVP